ncbi:MAG: DUF930 domain-containing protein [Ancalomicrobiaceae bacterium]|nr:DUF930 domain-containing protein [Ancalomicrobiaceae bacterium]
MDGTAQDWRTSAWGALASLTLHSVIGVALLLTMALPSPWLPPPSRTMEVDLLPAPLPDAEAVPAGPASRPQSTDVPRGNPDAVAALPDAARLAPSGDGTPAMITAARMLSETVLADPRSRQGRTLLAQLAPEERLQQLCGLEAMAQVAAWNPAFKPDQVVPYAMGEPSMSGRTLLASEAALHSRNGWYKLRFKCELTPDMKKVASFAFLVGSAIPRRDWDAHNLPAGDGPVE